MTGSGQIKTAQALALAREITASWFWALDGNYPNIDLETIALHEMGHGLSQAHFGKLFLTEKNGKFHWAPFALMNVGYVGAQRQPTGSDVGGHCSIWASWPNN